MDHVIVESARLDGAGIAVPPDPFRDREPDTVAAAMAVRTAEERRRPTEGDRLLSARAPRRRDDDAAIAAFLKDRGVTRLPEAPPKESKTKAPAKATQKPQHTLRTARGRKSESRLAGMVANASTPAGARYVAELQELERHRRENPRPGLCPEEAIALGAELFAQFGDAPQRADELLAARLYLRHPRVVQAIAPTMQEDDGLTAWRTHGSHGGLIGELLTFGTVVDDKLCAASRFEPKDDRPTRGLTTDDIKDAVGDAAWIPLVTLVLCRSVHPTDVDLLENALTDLETVTDTDCVPSNSEYPSIV